MTLVRYSTTDELRLQLGRWACLQPGLQPRLFVHRLTAEHAILTGEKSLWERQATIENAITGRGGDEGGKAMKRTRPTGVPVGCLS